MIADHAPCEGDAKLLRMAEQIARAVARQPDPAEAIAIHINAFWEPRMRRHLLELATRKAPMSDSLRAALPRLRIPG